LAFRLVAIVNPEVDSCLAMIIQAGRSLTPRGQRIVRRAEEIAAVRGSLAA
jgi:hypothetical protein